MLVLLAANLAWIAKAWQDGQTPSQLASNLSRQNLLWYLYLATSMLEDRIDCLELWNQCSHHLQTKNKEAKFSQSKLTQRGRLHTISSVFTTLSILQAWARSEVFNTTSNSTPTRNHTGPQSSMQRLNLTLYRHKVPFSVLILPVLQEARDAQ